MYSPCFRLSELSEKWLLGITPIFRLVLTWQEQQPKKFLVLQENHQQMLMWLNFMIASLPMNLLLMKLLVSLNLFTGINFLVFVNHTTSPSTCLVCVSGFFCFLFCFVYIFFVANFDLQGFLEVWECAIKWHHKAEDKHFEWLIVII